MTESKYGPGSSYTGGTNGTAIPGSPTTPISTTNKSAASSAPSGSGALGAASGHSEPPRSADQLREDIARTRSAISQDMAALGEKFKPDNLKENAKEVLTHAKDSAREGAKDMVREAKDAAVDSLRHAKDQAIESISESVHEIGQRARVVGHDVQDFVASHAVPLTLAGVGMGWLLVSLSHQRRVRARGYLAEQYAGERGLDAAHGGLDVVRERAGDLSRRASNALHEGRDRLASRVHDAEERVVERAGELRSRVARGASQVARSASHLGHEASELGHRAYDGVGRAGSRAVEVSEQNPLATGLLALAAGVAAGFLLPATRRENQLLGGTRDRLLQSAQRSANELKQSVEHGAAEVRGVIAEIQHPSH